MTIQLTLSGSSQSSLIKAGEYRPRPYQVRQGLAVDREHATKRSTLVVSAVGTGKTVLFSLQAAKTEGVLVVADRDTLIRQAAEKLAATTGCNVEIEKASERAAHSNYVVASIQTLRGERLKRFAENFQHIKLIIIDEAHMAVAKSYRDLIACWPNAKILGVTATPDRGDSKGLGSVFESVADQYDLLDATQDGWLAPLKWIPVHSSVDISHVKTRRQDGEMDLDREELDDEINKHAGEMAAGLLAAIEKYGKPDMRIIGFAPGVKTAHAAAAAMNELVPGSSAVVDGMMEDRLKRRVIERHRNGEFKYLWNCDVLTQGHDDKSLDGIFDASPTKSRRKAMQRWGRASRTIADVDSLSTAEDRRAAIAASAKPWGIVFDLAMNSSVHDIAGPLDLLAGRPVSDAVKRKAKQIFDDRGGSIRDVIEEAEEELRKERARARAAQRLAAAAKVSIGKPRSIFERAGLDFEKRKNLPTRPEDALPPKMRAYMKARGIPIPPNCNKAVARRLLGEDKKREKSGTCRLGGVEWLRQFGIDAWKMPSVVARRIQREIILNGRKPLTMEQLGPLLDRQPGEDDDDV